MAGEDKRTLVAVDPGSKDETGGVARGFGDDGPVATVGLKSDLPETPPVPYAVLAAEVEQLRADLAALVADDGGKSVKGRLRLRTEQLKAAKEEVELAKHHGLVIARELALTAERLRKAKQFIASNVPRETLERVGGLPRGSLGRD